MKTGDYLTQLDPNLARLIFKAKTRMLDIKMNYKNKYRNNFECPFCLEENETFDHLFTCSDGLEIPESIRDFNLKSFSSKISISTLKHLGAFLQKYMKYRNEII